MRSARARCVFGVAFLALTVQAESYRAVNIDKDGNLEITKSDPKPVKMPDWVAALVANKR